MEDRFDYKENEPKEPPAAKIDAFKANQDIGISDGTGTPDLFDALIGLVVGIAGIHFYMLGFHIFGSLVTLIAISLVGKLFVWDRWFADKIDNKGN